MGCYSKTNCDNLLQLGQSCLLSTGLDNIVHEQYKTLDLGLTSDHMVWNKRTSSDDLWSKEAIWTLMGMHAIASSRKDVNCMNLCGIFLDPACRRIF